MNTRWRLFFSYLAIIVALVVALSLAVRSIGIRAVAAHMAGMPGSSGMMAGDLQKAVTAGLNEAVFWGAVAAVIAAIVASYLVSGWITRPLRQMAEVAGRIAGGDYGKRVSYGAGDEIGRFAGAFNNMAGQLQKTEELRRELLGTISHEIRTPLATIEGYMQGLMDGVIPAEAETYELIRREASRLSRLVNDVERLSRLEAGGESIKPRGLKVAEAIEDAVAPLRPQFAQAGLSLSTTCAEPCPEVWADHDKLAQILGNLLSNALRYTPGGGSVKVEAHPRDSMVAFVVEDSGIGIPPQDLPHVFERFYRVDKSRSQAGGGSGIGLAVVKALVEQMGGRVKAESAPGTFTRFTFLLPRPR
jgi:histidine kinase